MSSATILVCGVGSGMERSLSVFRDMGYGVVVVTDRTREPALRHAERVIEAYPRDPSQVVDALRHQHLCEIAGVLSLGYENPPVIAELAAMFDTPGLSVDTAMDCTNKYRRITILGQRGIRVPRHRMAWDVPSTLDALAEIGRPAVVKPVDLTSSIGVARIKGDDSTTTVAELAESALRLSPTARLLVEEYLEGTEHTVEGVCDHGSVFITGVSDRNYADKHRFAPFFFENGDTLPSALPGLAVDDCVRECVRAASALGLDPAVFSCDVLRTHSGEVVILEVAARMAGSRFGTEIVPLSTGVNVLRSAIRIAVDERIRLDEVTPDGARPVVLRYLVCDGGLVTDVAELPDPATMDVYDLFWENRPRVGDVLPRPRSGKDLIAGVIATGQTMDEVEFRATSALGTVRLGINNSSKHQETRDFHTGRN
jgi:biotin carboxylase